MFRRERRVDGQFTTWEGELKFSESALSIWDHRPKLGIIVHNKGSGRQLECRFMVTKPRFLGGDVSRREVLDSISRKRSSHNNSIVSDRSIQTSDVACHKVQNGKMSCSVSFAYFFIDRLSAPFPPHRHRQSTKSRMSECVITRRCFDIHDKGRDLIKHGTHPHLLQSVQAAAVRCSSPHSQTGAVPRVL